METYGFPLFQWAAAKEEARVAMIRRANARDMTTYGELVRQIQSFRFRPHDFKLFHLLGQISRAESEAGRGMLSAVVVSKDENIPGPGFFALAKELGHSIDDPTLFWSAELQKVHSAHSSDAAWSMPKG